MQKKERKKRKMSISKEEENLGVTKNFNAHPTNGQFTPLPPKRSKVFFVYTFDGAKSSILTNTSIFISSDTDSGNPPDRFNVLVNMHS